MTERFRQKIRETVFGFYPASVPASTRTGLEVEAFVADNGDADGSWRWHRLQQQQVAAAVRSRTPSIAGFDLEPGGQWEFQSTPLCGASGIRTFAEDIATAVEAIEARGCAVEFAGVRPGGAAGRIVSPSHRHGVLYQYLVERGRYARAMMADTAALQITLDPHPFGWTLNLLRRVMTAGGFATPWNPYTSGLSRAAIWADVDPERTDPPRQLVSGEWSDEACLHALLRRPSICAAADDNSIVAWAGDFYDWVEIHTHALDDLERHYLTFLKQIYWPVKPRMKPEIRVLDARPPAAFGDCVDFLADIGVVLANDHTEPAPPPHVPSYGYV